MKTTLIVVLSAALFLHLCHSCPEECSCGRDLKVDCSDRSLVSVPDGLPDDTLLLDLSSNNLSSVEGIQQLVPRLQGLDLSGNAFTSVPSRVLAKLKHLDNLNLRDNQIVEVDLSDLDVFRGIKYVDVSGNQLKQWPMVEPASAQSDSVIETLEINNNRISALVPHQFSSLPSLTHLSVNRNKLRHVSRDAFQNLTKLRVLELSRNRLKKFESVTFRELADLHVLKIYRNGLRNLEDGTFHGAHQLQELHVNNNRLSRIEKRWLFGLNNLKLLDVRHNQLESVDKDAWRQCTRLEILDLSGNKFPELDNNVFRELDLLKQLILDDCRIHTLHNYTFRGLRSLKSLSLASNQLAMSIEDSQLRPFASLLNVEYLSLADNQLKRIPSNTFTGMQRLTTLDLNDNPLNTIAEHAFNQRPLTDLLVNSRSLLCDCHLAWLVDWLHNHAYLSTTTSVTSAGCIFPDHLIGHSLFDLTPAELTCNASNSWPQPILLESPVDASVVQGDNTTLACVVQYGKQVEVIVQWKHDNQIVVPSESDPISVTVTTIKTPDGLTQLTSQLDLVNVDRQDGGTYQCIVLNDYGTVYSKAVKLVVHVKPTFTLRPGNMSLRVGQTARMECAADGSPAPILSWSKDGGSDFPAARERRMHVLQSEDQDVFFVVNVQSRDAGIYSCTATNQAATISTSAVLNVLQEPSFRKPLIDKQARVGQTIVLECLADGAPPPSIQWYREGAQLPASQRYTFTGDKQLLVIVQVRPVDAGMYECQISNALGANAQSAYLTVFSRWLQPEKSDHAKQGNISEGLDDGLMLDYDQYPNGALGGVLGMGISTLVLCAVASLILCCFATSMVWLTIIWCRLSAGKTHKRAAAGSRFVPTTKQSKMSADEQPLSHRYDSTNLHGISSPVGGDRVLDMLDYYSINNNILPHTPAKHSAVHQAVGGKICGIRILVREVDCFLSQSSMLTFNEFILKHSFDTFGRSSRLPPNFARRCSPSSQSDCDDNHKKADVDGEECEVLMIEQSSSLDSGVNEAAMTVSNSTSIQ